MIEALTLLIEASRAYHANPLDSMARDRLGRIIKFAESHIPDEVLTATADAGDMHPREYIKAVGTDDRLMTDTSGNIVGPR